jgi:hypothetical protein
MGENRRVFNRPKLATQIRRTHKMNPDMRPAQIAAQLDTSPKYVSKVLRRARVRKFPTGPQRKNDETAQTTKPTKKQKTPKPRDGRL